jgi:Glyoxalase-like domain
LPELPRADAPRHLTQITIGDDPAAWAAAGFSVANGVTRVGEVDFRLVGAEGGRGILGWDLGGEAIDGLPYVSAVVPADHATVHANGATLIDHVVIASPDLDRTVAAFATAGFPIRRERVAENFGAPIRQCFAKSRDVILELIGGVEPEADGAALSRRASSPSGEFARAQFVGLALNVSDLDTLAADLGSGIGSIKAAVQPGRRIATLRHREFGISVPIAVMTE